MPALKNKNLNFRKQRKEPIPGGASPAPGFEPVHPLTGLRSPFSAVGRHQHSLWLSHAANRIRLAARLAALRITAGCRPVIAISQVVHLGDIVACEPVVRQVRRQQPDAFIIWAVAREYRELVDSHPDIDYTLALECPTEWIYFADHGGFDRVIDLTFPGRYCPHCKISWSPREGSHGIHYNNYLSSRSLLAAYQRCAGLPQVDDTPRLHLDNGGQQAVDRLALPEKFIVVHCQSNDSRKDLGAKNWLRIRQYIDTHYGLPVVEIGLQPVLAEPSSAQHRNLCGRLTILESAEVIRRSLLFLGTDSGPGHLANAVGAYGIIALGKYHIFKKYIPYSGRYRAGEKCERIHHDEQISTLPLKRIYDALERRLQMLGYHSAISFQLLTPTNTATSPEDYQKLRDQIQEMITATLPAGETVVVASKGDDQLLRFKGRAGWHFPQDQTGKYAGHYPNNSTVAIGQLEALRIKGGRYLLFPRTSLWWLNHYAEFAEHLKKNHRLVVRDDSLGWLYELVSA